MTEPNISTPADLYGSVDERIAQLAALSSHDVSAEWLRSQLESAFAAWAKDATQVRIDLEARTDF